MRNKKASFRIDGNIIFIPAYLTLESAEDIFIGMLSFLKKNKELESVILEFRELECYDSVIVAIMLAVLGAGMKIKLPVYFSHVEKGVVDLAELGGVDDLIVRHIIS